MSEQQAPILDESKLTPSEVQSCFLPGTNIQFAWDSTSLGLIKTCPRLYEYTMIQGWSPKDESVHLRFGQEYHTALEEYDHAMALGEADREAAIRDVVGNLLTRTKDWHVDLSTKAGKYKNRNTLIQLVVDYLDHFIDDPAETVILSNGKPAVELSFRFELDWGPQWQIDAKRQYVEDAEDEIEADRRARQPYLLCGHLDRVVNFNGQLLVLDHKTATSVASQYYFKQYEPNNQMTLYTLAGQVVLDTPIKGVVIDAAQILLTESSRFVRGFTYRTADQLEEWTHDLRAFLSIAESYAVANYWPMNDTSCDKFGGCKFREVCSKSPSVRDRFLEADFIKLEPEDRWNPLKAR